MDDPALTNFLIDLEWGPIQIAVMDREVQKAVQVRSRIVLFSRETLIKQRIRHPELTLEDYMLVNKVVNSGTVYFDRGRRIRGVNFVHRDPNRDAALFVAVKVTRDENQAFMVSFTKKRGKELRRYVRKAEREKRLLRK